MRVLTVRQPWAWAIVHGDKDVENRTRNIAAAYRGPVAIHAGLTPARFDVNHSNLWRLPDRLFTYGVIIGVVDLVDVQHDVMERAAGVASRPSAWAEPGQWHLRLAKPRPLQAYIVCKGALGLRNLDPVLETELHNQLGGVP